MSKTEKILNVISDFVKGGDDSDTELLDKVLHKDFLLANNGFMGSPGITTIDKQGYLKNIREGVFGGLPRKMEIESIDDNGTIAMVKIHLESKENIFVSYNSLILDVDDEWKLIYNLAVVNPKKQKKR